MVGVFSEYATRPEPIYEQVHGSLSADTQNDQFAVLGNILGCRPYKLDVNAALLGSVGVRLERQRDVYAVGARVVSLLTNYPWLQPKPNRLPDMRAVHMGDFDRWVGNHEFDDYPGIYGISSSEGHKLREHINGRHWDKNATVLVSEFCEKTGIVNDLP
jgi:hypothetical protein